LTKAFNVTSSTLRNWSAEFADYLSPQANPPKGQRRVYSDEDAAVLALVAIERSDKRPYAEIHAALADGAQVEWTPPKQEGPTRPEGKENRETSLVRLTATVAKFEGQLEAVTEERNHLRVKLDKVTGAHLAAEIRATEAETELKVVKDILDREKPTEEPESKERRSFLQRLFGR
jgi:DNA-binding transcriptional MerR regulator